MNETSPDYEIDVSGVVLMTSSNGNIFRVTGPLCGELTGPRRIPITKASDAELWCFSLICVWINGWVNNREAGDLRRYRAHYDVIVMVYLKHQPCISDGHHRSVQIYTQDITRTLLFPRAWKKSFWSACGVHERPNNITVAYHVVG